jgi:glycerophosphoryl diester phosphodiesterase
VPRDANNRLLPPTALVQRAHEAGLVVHPWTFRNETTFLPADLCRQEPASAVFVRACGDAPGEYWLFYGLGVDGLFSDNPGAAVAVRGMLSGQRN